MLNKYIHYVIIINCESQRKLFPGRSYCRRNGVVMLKRTQWRPIAIVLSAILLLAAAVFYFFIIRLNVLPDLYLYLITALIILILYTCFVLLFFRMRKKGSVARRIRRIIGIVFCIVLSASFLYGAVILNRVEQTKKAVTVNSEDSPRAVIGVYVMKDDNAAVLSDLGGHKIGVLAGLGDEKLHSNYALGIINEAVGTSVETESYAGIVDAAAALAEGDVQAIAVNKGFVALLNDTESFSSFSSSVRLIDEILVPRSATMDNTALLVGDIDTADSSAAVPTPTPGPTPEPTPEPIKYGEDRPLVFYLSGMDKYGKEIESYAHADVNILMAVNPLTKQVLLVSTPRDFYVMNHALGGYDKLTHCAIQGVPNSIHSLEELYEIHIDNYCRVNFTGFSDFINLIGGITVDNPVTFRTTPENDNYLFEAGTLNLDGYAALCYARERIAFGDGELARGRNQIRVIQAIIEKVKSNSASILLNYSDILDTLAGTFETDLSSSQMSDLIKVALGSMNDWDVKSYSAWGGSGKGVVASMGSQEVYFIFPNSGSVNFTKQLFQTILNGELITDEQLSNAP